MINLRQRAKDAYEKDAEKTAAPKPKRSAKPKLPVLSEAYRDAEEELIILSSSLPRVVLHTVGCSEPSQMEYWYLMHP